MLKRRVIPCLDVRGGRVVKGVCFDGLRDVGDPAELAAAYQQQGADEIIMLDVSATLEERLAGLDAIRRVRERLSIPLTVGGGVRDADDARRLLDAGADRVSVNSAAVARPHLLRELSSRFGAQCVVVAIDAERTPTGIGVERAGLRGPAYRVAVRSGTCPMMIEPALWAAEAEALGAGEVLLTSIERDGTGAGYDLELLRSVAGAVSIPVIASGGARSPADLRDALDAGADAVLIASMVHEGAWSIAEIKQSLNRAGFAVRMPEETT